jgi:hypothetical protein
VYNSPLWVISTDLLTEITDPAAAISEPVIAKCLEQLAAIVAENVKSLLNQPVLNLFSAVTVLKKTVVNKEDQMTEITPQDATTADQALTKIEASIALNTTDLKKTPALKTITMTNSLP